MEHNLDPVLNGLGFLINLAFDAFLLFVVIGVVRYVWTSIRDRIDEGREKQGWQQQRSAEQEEGEAQLATIMWLEVRELFPFLRTPVIDEPTAANIVDGILESVCAQPMMGQVIAAQASQYWNLAGMPVPMLPIEERKRHLYIVGKTGSGKSTFLEYLILQDMWQGHGVGIISPEGEFFKSRLLPMIPPNRESELIYFAPGHPSNTLCFNPLALEPGEDPVRAAEDLFTIFKRSLAETELGPRMQPILQNAFAILVGRPGATLWDVRRLLQDKDFRDQAIDECQDEYVQEFWSQTYPRYAKGSDLPIINRLDQFLRPPVIRNVLCRPESSFSIRDALRHGKILMVDLYGLSEENRHLIGQILLSRFQLELLRRELVGTRHRPFFLYADEFQSYASVAEGTWRELLSRGRKYGLALTLAHQYPAQIPTGLQGEILGNVKSIVSFALGAKDVSVLRNEFLQRTFSGNGEERIAPIPDAALIELPTGQAYAKLGGGRASRILTFGPIDVEHPERAGVLMQQSWQRYGAKLLSDDLPKFRKAKPKSEEPPNGDMPKPVAPEPVMPAPSVEVRQEELSQEINEVQEQEVVPSETPSATPIEKKKTPRKKAEKAGSKEPATPGRGGKQHKYLQELIKRLGEEKGYRATVEKETSDGRGRIDVALERQGQTIACEISITTNADQELGNIQKCLAAGYSHVVLISGETQQLQKVHVLATTHVSETDRDRLHFLVPEDFPAFLQDLEDQSKPKEETVLGYKVKVAYGAVDQGGEKAKKEAIAKTILQAMKRLKSDK